ncbi:MAG: cell division protein FtsZ [Anaerolineaceae bacterium]|nr:cell division protein FtsZ [Anaerolineaceae bacterium]
MALTTSIIKPEYHLDREDLIVRTPILKVIGLGGGGTNAIKRMMAYGFSGIEYIAANTDHQSLADSADMKTILLGPNCCRGLGAGGNPEIGEKAALESEKEIRAALEGADMVFLTAGMGGGTGTGAIPVTARIAKELGAVTVGIVTTPFSFEIGRRQKNSQNGLERLNPYSDTLITIPNDRLLLLPEANLTLQKAFRVADDILRQGIQGISELVTTSGLINVDFAHIRNMMQNGGGSFLSIGIGIEEDKAVKAVKQALNHPLLNTIPIENASGIIANFTGGPDLSFIEVMDALNFLQDSTNDNVEIIPGVINNEQMQNRVEVILVITGLGGTPVDTKIDPSESSRHPQTRSLKDEFDTKGLNIDTQIDFTDIPNSSSKLEIPAFLRRRIS